MFGKRFRIPGDHAHGIEQRMGDDGEEVVVERQLRTLAGHQTSIGHGKARGYVGRVVPERLQAVLDEVRPLAERFRGAGHRVYLVGGSVRDLLLGLDPAGIDFDLTTDATPDEIEAIVRPFAHSAWSPGNRSVTPGCSVG